MTFFIELIYTRLDWISTLLKKNFIFISLQVFIVLSILPLIAYTLPTQDAKIDPVESELGRSESGLENDRAKRSGFGDIKQVGYFVILFCSTPHVNNLWNERKWIWSSFVNLFFFFLFLSIRTLQNRSQKRQQDWFQVPAVAHQVAAVARHQEKEVAM